MKDILKDGVPLVDNKIKNITANRRANLMDAIWKALEERELGEWEAGFLDDMHKRLSGGNDLTAKQYEKTLEVLERAGIQGV